MSANMPPDPQTTIYLCTPPQRPYHCTFYSLSISTTIEHHINTHVEIASYRAACGDLGLRALPIKAVISPPTHFATDDHVYICTCCTSYFPLESSLVQHLTANGLAAPIIDLVGEQGLRDWIRKKCRRRITLAAAADEPDDGAAIDMLVNRVLRRGPASAAPPELPDAQPLIVQNMNNAVNFNGPCVRPSRTLHPLILSS